METYAGNLKNTSVEYPMQDEGQPEFHDENADLIAKLKANRDQAFKFQQRRHDQWTENYELYRDKVMVNRLTQRQSVNVPLMKESVRTILSGIDDPRDTIFEELGNDKDKEIFINEYWKYCSNENKLILKDIVDKKQVLLYGRSWWKLNVIDGWPYQEVLDPQDVLIDRYVDPTDIETAQFIIHQHIFRPLRELENKDYYDQEAVKRLKAFYATEMGLIKSSENAQSLMERNERLADMGVPDIDHPQLGETIVELNENYVKLWDEEKKKFILHLATTIDSEILRKKPLIDVLGVDFYPFVTWADDIERTDFYSDGWADVVRTPNKVLNAWFSQLIENRTLRNFGMNYYNSSIENFMPDTYEPTPFGWYPIPAGDKPINDIVKRVDIPDLSESLDEMTFLIQMVERATAATATEKGTSERNQITLGEVQLLAAKAKARIGSMNTFYQQAQTEFGEKWYKIIDANSDQIEAVKLYKKSYKGNYYEKEVSASDWKSKAGYKCRVVSSAEQEQKNLESIQKLYSIKQLLPNNLPFSRIVEKKLLDIADLTPEEVKEVMDFEEQQGQAPQGLPQGLPQLPQQLTQQLTQPNALPVAQ